ncbi:MAG: FkbM family methyltransferase [Flavobacteriaceae bacterium]|nr:FkbM family methyltransferase [Flavobacteriaceae bacterium]PCI21357.1 MAG: hypothetical protein COB64_00540 [Candidatus Wolfebacteria bacterium]
MKIGQNTKNILKRFGLLDSLYYFKDEVFSKAYSPMHISYKGHSFDMLGMQGDFHESIKHYGCYEPLMMDKAIEIIKSDDIIFDIGGAEGYFSFFASQLNDSPQNIYAFDGSECRGRVFKKNNRIIFDNKVNFIETFLSDHESKGVITIDSFIKKENIETVDVVKIDVEGAELKILKGMRESIKKFKPHLLIEIHPFYLLNVEKDNIDELCNFLEDENYSIELCSNHRGAHRGRVEPWKSVTSKDLYEYCIKSIPSKHNFAIYCCYGS